MDKYQLEDYRGHGQRTRSFLALRSQAELAIQINEERIKAENDRQKLMEALSFAIEDLELLVAVHNEGYAKYDKEKQLSGSSIDSYKSVLIKVGVAK